MAGLLFFVFAVISGLGLYFVVPIALGALTLLCAPVVVGYAMTILFKQLDDSEPGKKTKIQRGETKRYFADDYVLEYFNLSHQDQVAIMKQAKDHLPNLVRRLPSNTSVRVFCQKVEGVWRIILAARSLSMTFRSYASGFSASEALIMLSNSLDNQLKNWHSQRSIIGAGAPTYATSISVARDPLVNPYFKVLIVDDDIDAATMASTAFKSLGCSTQIATTPKGAISELINQDIDVVVLDWDLGNNIFASDIMLKAALALGAKRHANVNSVPGKIPKVVTYSSTEKEELWLPSSSYFHHAGHWQKPISLSSLRSKSKMLLTSHVAAA